MERPNNKVVRVVLGLNVYAEITAHYKEPEDPKERKVTVALRTRQEVLNHLRAMLSSAIFSPSPDLRRIRSMSQ